jgi:hypothetical protein
MSTPYECCPFHSDEDRLARAQAEDGWHLTCPRTDGHPISGNTYTWLAAAPDSDASQGSGLTAELGLFDELPAALGPYTGQWVEYGVLEAAYAMAQPKDFALLVERYGHTAVRAKRYTASAFLGRALGELMRAGSLTLRFAPATGRWAYNHEISWWSLPGETPCETPVSWKSLRRPMDYVPGNTEICPIGNCTTTNPADCHCT